MPATRLPGYAWTAWLRNLTLRVGVLTGVYLVAVMVAALLAANRVPFLEPVADLRNWAARAAFGLVMLAPVVTFRRSPARLFASATLGWLMLTLVYWVMGVPFENLHLRFYRPFHLFILGTSLYGSVAVLFWVASMILAVRDVPVVEPRQKPQGTPLR